MVSLTQCLDIKDRDANMVYYEKQLTDFEQTQSIEAICNAADIIGNAQRSFPISTKDRKKLFIKHIKTSLDKAHELGLDEQNRTCSDRLWTDLYVKKTAIIRQNRDMVICLDSKRTNGIYTSQAYDLCAKQNNYTP